MDRSRSFAFDPDPTERGSLARNLWIGGRLWSAAQAFTFIALIFAFWYLRELNVSGMWRPIGIKPPVNLGVPILICVLLAAVAFRVAYTGLRRTGTGMAWRAPAAISLLFMLAAAALICVQFQHAGFYPDNGSYASVFFGWTGIYLVSLLGAAYQLETELARTLREPVVAAAERPVLIAGVEGLGVYVYFLTLVMVATFILLYVVA